MGSRPLVTRAESAFQEGAGLALWVALVFRLAQGYLADGHLWLLHSQILSACLLLALILAMGSLIPRRAGTPVAVLVGGVTWAAALSMIPRFGWPLAPVGPWLLGLGAVLLGAATVLHFVLRRRWLAQLRGHGYRWILRWAEERPFYARRLARGVLRDLGYRPE